mmetsp:Transcript_26786/g.59165  ORF Transcript_26786/g.59165 Transcript_26786/m.59165 type:complete len:209 (+) Transcript_26786:1470-2096(+)
MCSSQQVRFLSTVMIMLSPPQIRSRNRFPMHWRPFQSSKPVDVIPGTMITGCLGFTPSAARVSPGRLTPWNSAALGSAHQVFSSSLTVKFPWEMLLAIPSKEVSLVSTLMNSEGTTSGRADGMWFLLTLANTAATATPTRLMQPNREQPVRVFGVGGRAGFGMFDRRGEGGVTDRGNRPLPDDRAANSWRTISTTASRRGSPAAALPA